MGLGLLDAWFGNRLPLLTLSGDDTSAGVSSQIEVRNPHPSSNSGFHILYFLYSCPRHSEAWMAGDYSLFALSPEFGRR